MTTNSAVNERKSWAYKEIKIDEELAALVPPLAKDELAQLEQSLLKEGCRDPLVVWKGKNILLDGHNRLSLCRRHNIPFEVNDVDLPDREAAKAFVVQNQLGRRNLSSEAVSYLRGKTYLLEKQGHGGDRRKARASDQSDRLKTAQRLAADLQVGEATIRRDGRLAAAVDRIAAHCGARAKQALLSRDFRLTRNAILWLARMKPRDQEQFIQELLEKGKPPRRPAEGKKRTITLPREPRSLAEKLFHSLGARGSSAVLKALALLLRKQKQ